MLPLPACSRAEVKAARLVSLRAATGKRGGVCVCVCESKTEKKREKALRRGPHH